MRPVQYFSDEYLERCRALSTDEIVRFLDDFRKLHAGPRPTATRLISMRVEEDLLEAFKTRAKLDGVPYQARIKELMRRWLVENVDD